MSLLHDTLRLGEPLATARGALILVHGRGSSPEDIVSLAAELEAPHWAFRAPAAAGGTWYPQRFFAPLEKNQPSLSAALATIEATVAELTDGGLQKAQIGLIGFSQGACLALEHVVRSGERYRFVAGLSGALIGPQQTVRRSVNLQRTPVLLGCAERDAHIPRDYVEHSATVLTSMNADVTQQIYRGSAHTVFPQEIVWLNEQLRRPVVGKSP